MAWIRGCTRAAYSVLHAPIIGDHDPLAALNLLATATPLVAGAGLPAKYVAMLEAEILAGLNRERETRQAIERAYTLPARDDLEGLFSGCGFLISYATMGGARLAAFAGRDLILLGHGDEGLDQLNEMLAAPTDNPRAVVELAEHLWRPPDEIDGDASHADRRVGGL